MDRIPGEVHGEEAGEDGKEVQGVDREEGETAVVVDGEEEEEVVDGEEVEEVVVDGEVDPGEEDQEEVAEAAVDQKTIATAHREVRATQTSFL